MRMLTDRARKFLPWTIVVVGACIAVGAYLQAFNYPYFSDDVSYFPENAKLIGLGPGDLWRLLTEPYNCCFEFLPLRDLSYWLDIKLFGLSPSASRGQNMVLYLLGLPLVYGATSAVWRYFRPADASSAPWVAATVASLFALHPALVESVIWISGRKYILPNLFAMLALWLAFQARRANGLSVSRAFATLAAFAGVMLSKTSYVGVAPLIALVWVLFWLDIPKHDRHRSMLLWPLAILFLAGSMTLIFVAKNQGFDGMPWYFGPEAFTRTFAVLGWLAFLAISPFSRHFLYPVFEDTNLYLMVAVGLAVMVAVFTSVILMLRKRSLEGFALAAFLLICMPYMQLIPNHPPSLVSDRYLALAVWPAILLIVALLWRMKRTPRALILAAIALLWGYQTIERPRDWRSPEALYGADLQAYPGYYMPAMFVINNVQLPQARYSEADKLAGSIGVPELRKAMTRVIEADRAVRSAVSTGRPEASESMLWDLANDYKERPAEAKWNSSILFFYLKNLEKLVDEWEMLAKRFPDDASLRYNAGLWMMAVHKSKHAVAHLRAASESPRLPESVRGTAFRNLGLALINSGDAADAEAPLRSALQQSPPDFSAYCLLSVVYGRTGRIDAAGRAAAECRNRMPNEHAMQ